jgi:lysophospholipase L1-like esterase
MFRIEVDQVSLDLELSDSLLGPWQCRWTWVQMRPIHAADTLTLSFRIELAFGPDHTNRIAAIQRESTNMLSYRIALISSGLVALLSFSPSAFAQETLVKSSDKIAFLGDSITEGGASHPAGYVRRVESGLQANGIKVTVIGAGISGHKSNQMLERLDRDVIGKKPDWMTLSCGVNDVWHGVNGVPLEAYKKNITQIVDKAQAAGIKVMILTATVIGEDLKSDNNKKLADYNAFLRTLAVEKKSVLADLNADMQAALKAPKFPGNRLTSDGVHMNPLGDRLMAHGILKAFGLNESQLKKANDHWYESPKTCSFSTGVALSLQQYIQLRDLADSKNTTMQNLIQQETVKAVESLLKQSK